MTIGRFVAYYRVSTAKQGDSGLGLESQQAAVRSYLNGGRWKLVSELTEIESGKRNDRPRLAERLRCAGSTAQPSSSPSWIAWRAMWPLSRT